MPTKPKAIILSGYGLNCEIETAHAFEHCGADAKIIHINDLIQNPKDLGDAQIFAVPGGFSYGDDTGCGNALAQKIGLGLGDALQDFVARDTLTIGICNGCQTLVNLGLLEGAQNAALTHNENGRYECRWVDLQVFGDSPWLDGIDRLHIPIAHGEGRFAFKDDASPNIVLKYINADGATTGGQFPYNPNGSAQDAAGIASANGRVLALMPHPERGMYTWQRDDYTSLVDSARRNAADLPQESDGMKIFHAGVRYFG